MKNPKMQELKLWLKENGKAIRELKYKHKENQRNHIYGSRELDRLFDLRWEYRHKHIAYSELRGHTREQIEPKLNEDTSRPDEGWITDIMLEVEAARIVEEERVA